MKTATGAWIYSPLFDGIFILSPAFLVSAAIALFPGLLAAMREVPLWAWVVLVMGIDVSHVYSTLYRTYLDPDEMRQRRTLYLMVPVVCWCVGVVLYSAGAIFFWRVLAYAAVFHFVRQQYGFMMIYRRGEGDESASAKLLDQAAIYLSTLYPLVYWHTHIPRRFSWFIDGDFVALKLPWLDSVTWICFLVVLSLYTLKECGRIREGKALSIPKNLFLLGTAVSWYVGIVAFNGDMAFTLTNVVSHGIPYIALIWAFGRKKWSTRKTSPSRFARLFSLRSLPLFFGGLLLLAYLEEALWDGFVWREHGGFFRGWHSLPNLSHSPALIWLVPLLVIPQATHYVLDGFIWKIRKPDQGVRALLESGGMNVRADGGRP